MWVGTCMLALKSVCNSTVLHLCNNYFSKLIYLSIDNSTVCNIYMCMSLTKTRVHNTERLELGADNANRRIKKSKRSRRHLNCAHVLTRSRIISDASRKYTRPVTGLLTNMYRWPWIWWNVPCSPHLIRISANIPIGPWLTRYMMHADETPSRLKSLTFLCD